MASAAVPTLRTLRADEADRYNAFFAAAARAHPDTLRIAPEDIAATPFATAPDEEGVTFVAEAEDGTWLGVGTIERDRGRAKRRHIAWIVRMYVAPDASGRGIGRAILRRALAHAATMPGIAKVNLTVAAHNAGAVHLYASEGFREFAREDDAFRDSGSRTELTMTVSVEASRR